MDIKPLGSWQLWFCEERAFLFEYDGTLAENADICLAMYDCDNPLAAGKDPTIRFDNKNTLPCNRLKLDAVEINGDVNADGKFTIADAVMLQKWLLADPAVQLKNWKAADFSDNNRLDAADLTMMKRALMK